MNTSVSRTAILACPLALVTLLAHAGTFQRQVPAHRRGTVHITNVAGSIVIHGWNKPRVQVTAELTSARQRVVLKETHGLTRVCVTNGASSCNWWSASTRPKPARLLVRVPRHSQINASGVSASITSHGITGAQDLQTVSGEIDAQLGSGNDDVKSVTGPITLRGSGRAGRLRVANVSGDLRATGVAGELDARTVNGTLTAEVSSARIVRLHTVSGEIDLTARLAHGALLKAATVSGNQHLNVVAPAGFSYTANTFSGAIQNCFGQQVQRNRYGPGSRLTGTRGAGHGQVRLKSMSGSITLCDH